MVCSVGGGRCSLVMKEDRLNELATHPDEEATACFAGVAHCSPVWREPKAKAAVQRAGAPCCCPGWMIQLLCGL